VSLYKYFKPDRLDVLTSGRIRYSQPAAFNDPFEGRPYYKGFADVSSLEKRYPQRFDRLVIEHYQSLSPELRNSIPQEDFIQMLEHLRPETYEIFRHVSKSFVPKINAMMHKSFTDGIGVLSLTEVRDNLLMWSHYAESHTGFVVEFDEKHKCFGPKSDNPDEWWRLHKVRYEDERPHTTVIELDFTAILLTKGRAWEYEKEWRVFRPLNKAVAVVEAKPFNIHLFDYPPACIRGVIMGARMPLEERRLFWKAIRQNPAFSHVRLYQANIDERRYSLKIWKIGSS
jgi:hypothetical protein